MMYRIMHCTENVMQTFNDRGENDILSVIEQDANRDRQYVLESSPSLNVVEGVFMSAIIVILVVADIAPVLFYLHRLDVAAAIIDVLEHKCEVIRLRPIVVPDHDGIPRHRHRGRSGIRIGTGGRWARCGRSIAVIQCKCDHLAASIADVAGRSTISCFVVGAETVGRNVRHIRCSFANTKHQNINAITKCPHPIPPGVE